jgi:hypothetical protein
MQTKTKTKKTKSRNDETSASILIESHYASIGVRKIWNQKRVERMCSFLRMTYAELGALIGIKDLEIKIHKTTPLPMSACILLSMFEKQYMGSFIPDPINNLFNFLGD